MKLGLLAIFLIPLARAAAPTDLAPGAPELLAEEARLRELNGVAAATATATTRLQTAWTTTTAPKDPCGDPDRLEIGWRIERFGSAWREAAQAARAQAERVRRVRASSTVAPLVDARWTSELDGLLVEADKNERAFVEASAWESIWVRPALAACPVSTPVPKDGIPMRTVAVRGDPPRPTAVLALGEGWVCPGSIRADDAVVLVTGDACWSASPTCGCTPAPVLPGSVLGAAVPETEPIEAPAEPASSAGK